MKPKRPDIKVIPGFSTIRILIDGILHVHIERQKLLGVSSWVNPKAYCIEYAMEGGGFILTEYDDAEKWKSILKQLSEVLS